MCAALRYVKLAVMGKGNQQHNPTWPWPMAMAGSHAMWIRPFPAAPGQAGPVLRAAASPAAGKAPPPPRSTRDEHVMSYY